VGLVEDADWASLRLILRRITGPPGSARENMYNAVALLPEGPTASKAEDAVGAFVDYLNGV